MSGDEGSTTGTPTPSSSADPPSPSDALSQVDVSTEDLAHKEGIDADVADRHGTTERERMEEGRSHDNKSRVRETGGS